MDILSVEETLFGLKITFDNDGNLVQVFPARNSALLHSVEKWQAQGGVIKPYEEPKTPIPPLTQARWNFLLDVTDSREVLEQILDAMPKKSFEGKIAWAAMKATALDAQTFHWDRTINLVQDMRDQGFEGIPTDEELREAWMLASKFEGVK